MASVADAVVNVKIGNDLERDIRAIVRDEIAKSSGVLREVGGTTIHFYGPPPTDAEEN